jgi:alcohol dehydrogenase
VVARRSAVKIDKDIPLDDAAIFGCAVMTGAGAVINTARLQPGENVAVVGLGGVGMNALFAAVASGADRIIAVDTNPKKLEQAKEWGATDVFLAGNDDCAAAVRDATDGGVDTVIETAGTIPAMQLAIAITARGGSTISAGSAECECLGVLPACEFGVGGKEHSRVLYGVLRGGTRHSAPALALSAREDAGE